MKGIKVPRVSKVSAVAVSLKAILRIPGFKRVKSNGFISYKSEIKIIDPSGNSILLESGLIFCPRSFKETSPSTAF